MILVLVLVLVVVLVLAPSPVAVASLDGSAVAGKVDPQHQTLEKTGETGESGENCRESGENWRESGAAATLTDSKSAGTPGPSTVGVPCTPDRPSTRPVFADEQETSCVRTHRTANTDRVRRRLAGKLVSVHSLVIVLMLIRLLVIVLVRRIVGVTSLARPRPPAHRLRSCFLPSVLV